MGNDPSDQKENAGDVTIRFGHDELVIRQRYEVISIINDILIGTWFIIGTIFFFFPSFAYAGTWLFLLGSIEMMIDHSACAPCASPTISYRCSSCR